jgi:WD40 repeat protein
VEELEEVILGLEGSPLDAGPQSKAIQQKLTSQLKRDSMVAASHLSQKIKSTYKLKTSGKIFNKVHSNVRSDLLGKYELHKDGVWFITATHRHNRLLIATASADGTACITDMSAPVATANPVATYTGHQGCSVNCVRFHPKLDLVITASGDGGSHLWRPNLELIFSESEEKDSPDDGLTIRQPMLELMGHSSVVSSCDWMSTVDQCVTASWDRTANLYDLHTGEMVVQLVGHDQELTDVTAHPSSPLIVTSSHDTTFRLWDFRESIHSVCVFQGHSDRVNSTVFLGQDKVASGSDDRTVKVWDLKNMRSPLANIHVESPINKLGVNSQGTMMAIPLENRTVRVYDGNGTRLCRFSRSHHERMVTCACFAPLTSSPTPSPSSPLTGQVFTCGFDRRVCWWSLYPEKTDKIKEKD